MTNKDKYIAELRARHPELPQEFFDFCAVIPDYDKAMHYADLLGTCSTYADIAQKVIRPMYVSGDIDSIRAKSEKFLALLLPLACLSVKGNPHAAVHHVKKIIDDDKVKDEREQLEAKRRELWQASQTARAEQQLMPFSRITIEILDTESMQMFLAFLQSAGTRFRVEENKHFHGLSDAHRPKECIAIEETPQWFLAAFTDLQAHCPDARLWSFSFLSDWIDRDDITLTETLSLIQQELS